MPGDVLYAGGRIIGAPAEMEVIKDVSQGYLVSLWSSSKFASRREGRATRISQKVGARFTVAVIAVSLATFVYWFRFGIDGAITNTTAVLIVACPCALALSIPFTFGTVMQIFGRRGLFLREPNIVENLAQIDAVVFDKTGTLTSTSETTMRFVGEELTEEQMAMLKGLALASTHPLSRRIAAWASGIEEVVPEEVQEFPGQGIIGYFDAGEMRLGSSRWVAGEDSDTDQSTTARLRCAQWCTVRTL